MGIQATEEKFKTHIQQLESNLQHTKKKLLELGMSPIRRSSYSYDIPATNKNLVDMFQNYCLFLKEYVVKAHLMRVEVVEVEKKKILGKYIKIFKEFKETYPFLNEDNFLKKY